MKLLATSAFCYLPQLRSYIIHIMLPTHEMNECHINGSPSRIESLKVQAEMFETGDADFETSLSMNEDLYHTKYREKLEMMHKIRNKVTVNPQYL
ncbi:Hypothetical predicted protein [Olea europaea subsp. europaea]|uniref:Uncharacterized protein n=1 Tax=Olea europaea subsp. europaea TaxID=158383 RepID=A0A8S0QJ50_OLEEU|nr:Hypothetical predicted protein [Olea europaea subsp. europaea]